MKTEAELLREGLEKILEVPCAGMGRCDMFERCGGCTARAIARRTLEEAGKDSSATVRIVSHTKRRSHPRRGTDPDFLDEEADDG